MCGVNIGLFLPLKIDATTVLKRPRGTSSASTNTHFFLISLGLAENVLKLKVSTIMCFFTFLERSQNYGK
jgi:hypothetical protein